MAARAGRRPGARRIRADARRLSQRLRSDRRIGGDAAADPRRARPIAPVLAAARRAARYRPAGRSGRCPGGARRGGADAAVVVAARRLGDDRSGERALALRLLRAAADLPAYERRLRDVLSAIGPDVLHTNGFKAHIVGARARRPCRGLVWHVHEYAGDRPMTRRLLRRYARRASVIVANSESVAADVRGIAGAGCRRARHLQRRRSRSLFPAGPVDRSRRAVRPDSRAGRHGARRARRDVQPLERARDVSAGAGGAAAGVCRFADTSSAARCTTPTAASIRPRSCARWRRASASTAASGSRGSSIRWTASMRALDVVVHASTLPEPFGLVIAEAMACGRAVITSGTGGAGELVRDGVDAVTHRPGDAGRSGVADREARRRTRRSEHGSAARRATPPCAGSTRRGWPDEFAATYERRPPAAKRQRWRQR